MDDSSVGERLKAARIKKNLSVEQISRDTFISIRLLNALEDERYEEFTSEVYLVGFLKSYAKYLDLDSDEIVQRYRNMRVQEQSTPIDELLKKSRPAKKPILIAASVIIIAIGAVLLLGQLFFFDYFASFINQNRAERADDQSQTDVGTVYSLENDFLEREFGQGDKIDISIDGESYTLEVEKIGRVITLGKENERFRLQNNERTIIDLDLDRQRQIEVLVRDVIRDRESPRVIMRVLVYREERLADSGQESGAGVQDGGANRYGNTAIASRRRAATDLGDYPSSATFPVQISFTAPVFLQYQIDDDQRISQLYGPQDIVTLAPSQQLMVWVTNAGAVNFNVVDRFVPIGDSGEVTSFVIKKSSSSLVNRDTLEIVPLY